MMWTKEPPTKEGHYWVQWIQEDWEPTVVYVYLSPAGLRVANDASDLNVSPPEKLGVHSWWPEPVPTPWRALLEKNSG